MRLGIWGYSPLLSEGSFPFLEISFLSGKGGKLN